MITVILLFVLCYYIFQKKYKYTGIYPLIAVAVPVVMYILFIIEVGLTSLDYFVSDELIYKSNIQQGVYHLDRYFWVVLNQHLLNIDIFGTVALKLVSIPVLFFTLYMLWSIFFNDKRIFLIVLIIPYIAFIATKNLRDIFILFFIVSIFYCFYKLKNRWLVVFPVLLLFFTRPFMAFIAIGLIIYDLYIKKIFVNYINISILRNKFTINIKLIKYLFIVVALTYIFLSVPYVNKRLNSYWYYFIYYTAGEGYEKRLESSEALSTGYKFLDYSYGAIRYVFAPIPTSLFGRLLKGGTSDWGIIDDLIRLINQIFYYFLLLYVLINIRNIFKKFKLCPAEIRLFTISMLFYLPLYTFYGFGMGHQRIKIPFQIGVFMFYIINKNVKLRRRYDEN